MLNYQRVNIPVDPMVLILDQVFKSMKRFGSNLPTMACWAVHNQQSIRGPKQRKIGSKFPGVDCKNSWYPIIKPGWLENPLDSLFKVYKLLDLGSRHFSGRSSPEVKSIRFSQIDNHVFRHKISMFSSPIRLSFPSIYSASSPPIPFANPSRYHPYTSWFYQSISFTRNSYYYHCYQ